VGKRVPLAAPLADSLFRQATSMESDSVNAQITQASFSRVFGPISRPRLAAMNFNDNKSVCGTTFVNDYIEAVKHDK
jgi:hypothetical protein